MTRLAFQPLTPLSSRHFNPPVATKICERTAPRAKVTTVSPKQLSELLDAPHHSSNIVVLKCYANYCRSCKGVEPKFRKIAHAYQSDCMKGPNIIFCQMDYALNEEFCRDTLGVHTLPFFSIWKDGQHVTGEAMGWKSMNSKLISNIEMLVNPTPVPLAS